MISKKHKNVSTALSYIYHLFILASVVTGYDSIFAFASLASIYIDITTSAVGLIDCEITAKTYAI